MGKVIGRPDKLWPGTAHQLITLVITSTAIVNLAGVRLVLEIPRMALIHRRKTPIICCMALLPAAVEAQSSPEAVPAAALPEGPSCAHE